MRVAFIEPKPPFNVYYFLGRFPLLGGLTMGTMLKQAGHEVRVFKENLVHIYRRRGTRFHPFIESADVVGITGITHTINRAYDIAETIKERFPEKRVIMGGPHVSALPHEALEHADQVVVGEGESVIRPIVEGRLQKTLVQGAPVNMDDVPPLELDILEGYRGGPAVGHGKGGFTLPVAPIMASRGCPYDCIFCSVTKLFGRKYRVKEPALVMEEIRKRYAEGYREAFFYDDNFAANPKKTKELLRMLIEADLDFHWSSQFSVHVGRDPEMIELLRASKCRTLFVGVESVSPEALEDLRKSQDVGLIRHSLKALTDAGLGVHAMFILGTDSDTEQSIDETVRFSRRIKAETAQFSVLFPIPGTDLYNQVKADGRILSNNWDDFDGSHAIIRPNHMSAWRLQKKLIKAYTRFYERSVIGFIASRIGVILWTVQNIRFLRWLRRTEKGRSASTTRNSTSGAVGAITHPGRAG